MHRTLSGSALLTLVLASFPPALAAEGRTPVFEPGTVITTDGSYVVTQNLDGLGQTVITIVAEHVHLDLNGFELSSNLAPSVIEVAGAFNDQQVVIRNGGLRNANTAIRALGDTRQLTIEDVKIHYTQLEAIHVGLVQTVVMRRVEIRNAGAACFLWDDTQDKEGSIEDSVFRICGGSGIAIRNACASVEIAGNQLQNIAGHGIELYQCRAALVTGNTVAYFGGSGVRLSQGWGNNVTGNTITNGFGNGIHVDDQSSSNLIAGNNCTHNGALSDWGLRIDGSFNKIEGNVVNENFGGILFTSTACGNTFGRNVARGNAHLPSACTGTPALFPPNSCNNGASCIVPNTTLGDNLIPGPPVF